MTAIRDLILMLFVFGGALLGSQLPPFANAYLQRLGGAVDELQSSIAGFESAARGAKMTFDEYRVRLRTSEDAAFRSTGDEIDRQVERSTSLAAHQRALAEAGSWTRPLLVLAEADRPILTRTWENWAPTLTLDPRWGLIGLFVGWLLHAAIGGCIGLVSGPPRRRGGLRS